MSSDKPRTGDAPCECFVCIAWRAGVKAGRQEKPVRLAMKALHADLTLAIRKLEKVPY
jgi:hypothetical protein